MSPSVKRFGVCLPLAKIVVDKLHAWYRETNRSRAEERFRLLEGRIASDSLPEFRSFYIH